MPEGWDSTLLNTLLAFEAILHPFMEVIVHDWRKQEVVFVQGNLTNRKIGDPSFMDETDLSFTSEAIIGPYRKTNPDGRQIKSISVVARDWEGAPQFLICLNLDVSQFAAAQTLLQAFTSIPSGFETNPLADDWVESLHEYIGAWRIRNGAPSGALSVEARRALVAELNEQNAFARPNAVPAVAIAVGVSRATLYADLKALG
ncbi:MAG: PAS domain-containing protein [Pseudomonadota bacterium]